MVHVVHLCLIEVLVVLNVIEGDNISIYINFMDCIFLRQKHMNFNQANITSKTLGHSSERQPFFKQLCTNYDCVWPCV